MGVERFQVRLLKALKSLPEWGRCPRSQGGACRPGSLLPKAFDPFRLPFHATELLSPLLMSTHDRVFGSATAFRTPQTAR